MNTAQFGYSRQGIQSDLFSKKKTPKKTRWVCHDETSEFSQILSFFKFLNKKLSKKSSHRKTSHPDPSKVKKKITSFHRKSKSHVVTLDFKKKNGPKTPQRFFMFFPEEIEVQCMATEKVGGETTAVFISFL